MTGDHGSVAPWYVNTAITVAITMTDNTATGRRLGARSPRLDTNGTSSKAPISTTGKARMMNVSAPGGLSERSANNHQKGQSGFGLAPSSAGSGRAPGPLGPAIAARTTITTTVRDEKRASFKSASPKKGTPSFFSSFSYSSW